jgi:hypothetical protein
MTANNKYITIKMPSLRRECAKCAASDYRGAYKSINPCVTDLIQLCRHEVTPDGFKDLP